MLSISPAKYRNWNPRDGPTADLGGSITSLASKSHRLHLQPEDERSASVDLPLSQQSVSDPSHSNLERNCLRRELRCCCLPHLSNTSRSRLSYRPPFLCFPQGCPATGHYSRIWRDLNASP